jgi:hypothetical protein
VEVIFTRTQEAAVFLEKLDETVKKRADLELDYGKRLQGFGKGLEQERGYGPVVGQFLYILTMFFYSSYAAL